jgi:hypothetical protein
VYPKRLFTPVKTLSWPLILAADLPRLALGWQRAEHYCAFTNYAYVAKSKKILRNDCQLPRPTCATKIPEPRKANGSKHFERKGDIPIAVSWLHPLFRPRHVKFMFGLLLYAFMGDNRGEWLVCMTGPLHPSPRYDALDRHDSGTSSIACPSFPRSLLAYFEDNYISEVQSPSF